MTGNGIMCKVDNLYIYLITVIRDWVTLIMCLMTGKGGSNSHRGMDYSVLQSILTTYLPTHPHVYLWK
jgi:hypothetical protein